MRKGISHCISASFRLSLLPDPSALPRGDLSQAPLPGTPHTQTGTACLPHKGLRCSHGSLPTPEAAHSPPGRPRCPSCPRVEGSFMKRPLMGMERGMQGPPVFSHLSHTRNRRPTVFPQTTWVDRSQREDANGLLPPPWWSPPQLSASRPGSPALAHSRPPTSAGSLLSRAQESQLSAEKRWPPT